MNRRQILTSGSALLASASGCLTNDTETHGVDRIDIANRHTTPLVTSTTIRKNGDVEYETETTVSAGDEVRIQEQWMREPAAYVITVSLSNDTEETLSTETLNERYELGNKCYEFEFVIDSEHQIRPHVGSEPCNTD